MEPLFNDPLGKQLVEFFKEFAQPGAVRIDNTLYTVVFRSSKGVLVSDAIKELKGKPTYDLNEFLKAFSKLRRNMKNVCSCPPIDSVRKNGQGALSTYVMEYLRKECRKEALAGRVVLSFLNQFVN